MKQIAFGMTGRRVSALALGTGPIGLLGANERDAVRLLREALDTGVTVIDTAACYNGSEEMIGQAISERRDEYMLVSKCGHEIGEINEPEWSPSLIRQTVDRALRRLKTDYIDVMLLHSCDLAVLQKGEAMTELIRAREAGKVRLVGYSGDNEAVAFAARLPDVSVVEMSINICDQANIDNGLQVARDRGLGVLAKRSLCNAAWKKAVQQQGFYADYAAPYAERLKAMNIDPASLGYDVGKANGNGNGNGEGEDDAAAWPELALRFTISIPGVHAAIVGTTNPDNVRADIAAVEKGPLPDEMVRRIRNAFQVAEKASNKTWQGLT